MSDGSDVSVVAYFGDDPTRVYQLVQWLPVLERLDRERPVVVVARDPDSADLVSAQSSLAVRVAPTYPELTELYDELDAKVVAYCNNSPRNFESLVHTRALHVHVNHGESDKQSMASNNAKAYDRVFVAGTAGAQRYEAELLDFDASRLVRVGRPQLDLDRTPLIGPSPRHTVLYAPTWEGDADYNCYSSLDVMGELIVAAALAVPDARVVYKPHPKVVTSATPAVRRAHQAVVAALSEATVTDPGAGHLAVTEGDILAVMPACDLMVTDVSSVGLDWLYLHTDRPLMITDRHGDAEQLRRDVPVSRGADVVDADSVEALTELLSARLAHDEHHLARMAMRRFYFDDLAAGQSTRLFLDAIGELADLRDRLVAARDAGAGQARAQSRHTPKISRVWSTST